LDVDDNNNNNNNNTTTTMAKNANLQLLRPKGETLVDSLGLSTHLLCHPRERGFNVSAPPTFNNRSSSFADM